MPTLKLMTHIKAPPISCFELSRSIDMHLHSMKSSHEKVIAGRTNGAMMTGETVTWNARHFGFNWTMTVKMGRMEIPHFFEDYMVKGPFKSMRHQHYFESMGNGTNMIDIFHYESPLGLLGKLIDRIVLKRYMNKLLTIRNAEIKLMAEQCLVK